MKKGCFIKAIIILTIIVASITYIIQNRFNDFIFKPGKKIILPLFLNEFKNKLATVRNSSQKDSLYVMIKDYIEESQNIHDLSNDNLKPLVERLNSIVSDSVVTSAELNDIKDYIKNSRKNEGSEKN